MRTMFCPLPVPEYRFQEGVVKDCRTHGCPVGGRAHCQQGWQCHDLDEGSREAEAECLFRRADIPCPHTAEQERLLRRA